MDNLNIADIPTEELDQPAIIIDLVRCEIIAGNAAGRRLWGLPDTHELPMPIDPDMPAFGRLREAGSGDEVKSHVFWTQHGAQSLRCSAIRLSEQTVLLMFQDDVGTEDVKVNGRRCDSGGGLVPVSGAGSGGMAEPSAASTGDASTGVIDLRAMAHELRTPMAAVIALAEMIEREQFGPLGDPRYREYARDIGDSARLTLHIVASALENDISEGGILPGGFAEIDVSEIIRKCFRAVRQTAVEAGVELERLDKDLPKLIANGPALTQILLNLLTNAIKFTPSGGRITFEALTGDDGSLMLSVTDTGVGMTGAATRVLVADHEANELIEKTSATEDGPVVPSRGIGFSLVRRLAGAMDAHLDVSSTRGVGTRVSISFPAGKVVPVARSNEGQ